MIHEYEILVASDSRRLATVVRCELSKGWRTSGGIAVDGPNLMQAMERSVHTPEEIAAKNGYANYLVEEAVRRCDFQERFATAMGR